MKALDEFYAKQDEPNKSCLLALRDIILGLNPEVTPEWKYKLPFFYYRKKMFCYFWFDKKTRQPYIGFMRGPQLNHPALFKGDKKMVKKLFIEPDKDLPIDIIGEIAQEYFQSFED